MTFYLFHLWSKLFNNLTADDTSFVIFDWDFPIIAIFPLSIFRVRIEVRWNNIFEIETVIDVGWDNQYSWPVMVLNNIKKYLVPLKFQPILNLPISYFTNVSADVKGLTKIYFFMYTKVDFDFWKQMIHWTIC